MSDSAVRPVSDSCVRRHAARGFTIVEVVVAMTLLVSGALVVVGASAAAVRAVSDADGALAAMAAAQRRLEGLALPGCRAAVSGTATDASQGLREWWRVTSSRNGLRLAIDSVEYVDRGRARFIVRGRLVVC